jgi:hypothetical protein
MNRPTDLQWVKSSRSVGVGACLELATDGDMIALRDSKVPDTVLHYTHTELSAFLWAAKRGEFDHFLRPRSP